MKTTTPNPVIGSVPIEIRDMTDSFPTFWQEIGTIKVKGFKKEWVTGIAINGTALYIFTHHKRDGAAHEGLYVLPLMAVLEQAVQVIAPHHVTLKKTSHAARS